MANQNKTSTIKLVSLTFQRLLGSSLDENIGIGIENFDCTDSIT